MLGGVLSLGEDLSGPWPRLTVRMRGLDDRPVSCLVQESPLCSMASSRPPFQVPVMASPL